MARPSPAIIGSIALHAGVGALMLYVLTKQPEEPRPVIASIPVSIISDTITVEAAPGENPTDEVVPETETAPPPPPTPETPPPPTPRPTTTPTPRPPVTPPRQPPRPPTTQPREEPTLNTEDLLTGKRRRADRDNRRPPSGDRGQGSAPRAIGQGDLRALGAQVRPIWNCDLPGAEAVVVRVFVRLDESGRIVGSPRLDRPRSDAAYRAISDSLLRGFRAAVPFDMPAGYQEQELSFVFPASQYC